MNIYIGELKIKFTAINYAIPLASFDHLADCSIY